MLQKDWSIPRAFQTTNDHSCHEHLSTSSYCKNCQASTDKYVPNWITTQHTKLMEQLLNSTGNTKAPASYQRALMAPGARAQKNKRKRKRQEGKVKLSQYNACIE